MAGPLVLGAKSFDIYIEDLNQYETYECFVTVQKTKAPESATVQVAGRTPLEKTTTGQANIAPNEVVVGPNPAKDEAVVFFNLEKPGIVVLSLNSIVGGTVELVRLGNLDSGQQQYRFDTTNVPTGVYLATVLVDGKPLKSFKLAVVK